MKKCIFTQQINNIAQIYHGKNTNRFVEPEQSIS